ncbi:MAG: hypothetical protein UR43_C0014G0016 [candidate division TM6 bacterium GW2011_GWF2_33_332]|nr:MAG: hypothetical protein UR43_C0014G0016 [candidate division TM6 bacterium GW2011_GWF2_33_332]
MKKSIVVFSLLSFLVLFSSCSARFLDFTILSSKNVTIDVKKDVPRTTGKASSIKGAIDKAIENAGVGYDALIDGVIYYSSYYCVLFSITRYTVEGTPIKSAEINK